MERNAFVRQSDELDAMCPMSDSDHEVFADSPRMARSLALLAKRRQAKGVKGCNVPPASIPKRKEEPKFRTQNDRKMWEDITTDDEDTFPQWAPQARVARSTPSLPATEEGSAVSEGLGWDPIGLGSTGSTVTELLYNKNQSTNKMDSDGTGATMFDKWSWSTTATETAENGHGAQEDNDKDTTPKSSSSQEQSISESSESQGLDRAEEVTGLTLHHLPVDNRPIQNQMPVMLQNQVEAPYPAMAVQQMILPLTVANLGPVGPQLAPVAPMAPMAPGPLAPMMPGQLPMPLNLGMLPILMSMPQPQPTKLPAQPEVVRPNASATNPSTCCFEGPPFGKAHRFHQKNSCMGVLSSDARSFTKRYNKGRLSIICENKVHFQGTVRYAVQFTEGELCSADGVGFILSSDLPCTRNIQKIVSIFANRTGRICIRVHDEVVRCPQRVKCLEIGDWLEVKADLVNQTVGFTVWPQDQSAEPSFATVSFKETFKEARGRVNGLPRSPCGFLAVVVKHLGVSVNLGS